jgi:glucose/arabinose dehydrogenase
MSNTRLLVLVVCGVSLVSHYSLPLQAQSLRLEPVITSGLWAPIFLTAPPGDNNRLFILERGGAIRVFDRQTNTLLPTPYASIPATAASGEQGLLGLAFDPDFANNGRFYVNYSRDGIGDEHGDIVVARYTASGDPMTSNVANTTAETLLVIDHTEYHYGGWIGFRHTDPGRLYVAVGDSFLTVPAQNVDSLLGKMLRIDVSGPTGYTIPEGNLSGGLPEIYQYGLRNPWRNSFDRATGDLWIADVGQNLMEEINYQAAGSPGGQNFGWAAKEGTLVTGAYGPGPFPDLIDPIYEYGHEVGQSITGGYVYRGSAMPSMQGQYFFGDFSAGRTWTLQYDGESVTGPTEWTDQLPIGGYNLASFGEDAQGELYMVGISTGEVYRIVESLNEWSQIGSATWHTANHWSSETIPNGGDDIARLWGAILSDATVDIESTDTTVNTLSFRNEVASYTVAASSEGRLFFAPNSGNASIIFENGNTRDHTISAPMTLDANVEIRLGAEHSLTLSGQQDWGGRTVTVQSGLVRYTADANAANTMGASLQIAPDASAELAGAASATSDGTYAVNVTNEGAIRVISGQQEIGALNGNGQATVLAAATLSASHIRQSSLSLDSGSVVELRADGGATVLGSLSIAGDEAPTANLDLNNNAAIVDYAGPSPAAAIRAQILAGRGGPGAAATWSGPGISSSAAADAEPLSRSIGYAENAELPLGSYSTFSGQPVDATSVLIAFTRTGDANLDGVVDNDDVAIVGANYAPGFAKPRWDLGDFDYNGFVDNDDVALLGAYYNPEGSPVGIASVTENLFTVPEPASLALLSATVCVFLLHTTRRSVARD